MNKIINAGDKYLITTNQWFYGPDGEQYRAVYGAAEMIEAKYELGFTPTRSANWYVRVGTENHHIVIAGCQIHYALRTDERPEKIPGKHAQAEDGKRPTPINVILFLDE